MNKNSDLEQIDSGGFEAPPWVSDLLGQFHGSASFRERSRDAASAAHSIVTMRKEQERTGFAPLSLGRYLRGLAEITKVSLQPVLRWAAIADLDRVSSQVATAMARVAREIGLSHKQAELMLRIGVAENLGYASFPLAVNRNGDKRRGDDVEICDNELGTLESQYPFAAREEVRLIIEAVEKEYSR